MKNLLFLLAAVLIASCGSKDDKEKESIPEKDILGKWKLIKVEESKDNPMAEHRGGIYTMDECDTQTVWEFLDEDDEPLSGGTKTKKIIATAPEACEWYGFESKWALAGGKVFISSTRVGGIGGPSYAGRFSVKTSADNTLELTMDYVSYTFEKAE